MNFRFILLIGILLMVISCGVKSLPLVPPNSEIPGYEEQFLDTKEDLKKKDKKS